MLNVLIIYLNAFVIDLNAFDALTLFQVSVFNQLIAEFLKKDKKSAFADVYSKMLKADGSPMDDIFLQDRLHMTAKGYVIWKKILEPLLIK